MDRFTYFGSCVSSTENDINKQLAKAWTVIDCLSVIWKSGLSNKIKHNFFQLVFVSKLLYRLTTWTLTKRIEKKLDNCARMLRAIINKPRKQNPTKQQLYGHLLLISKNIQIRRTRHAGHCWRSNDKPISDVLLWTLSNGRASIGRPVRTYLQQLCTDTGYKPEKNCWKWWMVGTNGERVTGKSILTTQHDDICIYIRIDDIYIYIYIRIDDDDIYIYIYKNWWWWWYIYIYIYI